jgi:ABC-type bacteriocin/lantibiotic exporter with double-glycine peptidase domain
MKKEALLCALFVSLSLFGSAASGKWIDVPFVKQEKEGCGAAVISMVMQYWHREADAAQIMKQLFSPKAGGIYASDMQRYFEENGFRVFAFRANRSDLQNHLEKGRPLIVCLDEDQKDKFLHYVVVAGFEPEENIVYLNDPAEKKMRKTDWSDFEGQWKRMNYWTLLALPGKSQ